MEQGTFDFGGDTSPAPVKLCGCGCGKPAPIASRTVLKRGVIKGQPLKFIRNRPRNPWLQPWGGKGEVA